jgi:hypothetical protein
MPRKVLLQTRTVASGSAANLPVTINASSYATIQAIVSNLITNLQQNEVVRIRILHVLLTCSDNSSIVIQNANLQCDSAKLIQPAFSGSPLGRASNASFSGELNFQTRDVDPDTSFGANVTLLLQNTDSSNHTVTAFTVTLEVVRTQWDAPSYGPELQ